MNIERFHHLAGFEFEIPQNEIALLGNRLLRMRKPGSEYCEDKGSDGQASQDKLHSVL